ncbi:nuclear transport factor 2 family protein [Candidatus Cloacimonadota bacterium]
MKILVILLYTIFALFMLYTLSRTLENPHEDFLPSQDSFIFSKGNAPDSIRTEIIYQLNKFQDGYIKRDTSLINSFMQQLFTEENTLILGVMPNEICIGQKGVKRLLFGDWNRGRWGNCTFLIENANISSHGDVAWISTIGNVKMDFSSYLVLPLRLTGVMVKENGFWKFQQLQFQFNLDFTYVLITMIFMIILVVISIIIVIIVIIRFRNKPRAK